MSMEEEVEEVELELAEDAEPQATHGSKVVGLVPPEHSMQFSEQLIRFASSCLLGPVVEFSTLGDALVAAAMEVFDHLDLARGHPDGPSRRQHGRV